MMIIKQLKLYIDSEYSENEGSSAQGRRKM